MKIVMVEKIVQLLNEVFKINPAAIDSLICLRVPVNAELMNHPDIQVSCKSMDNFPGLGMLGFLNGLSVRYENKYIVAKYDELSHCLIGFEAIPIDQISKKGK